MFTPWIRLAILSAGLVAPECAVFGQTFEVASVKRAPVPQDGKVFFGPPRGGPGTSDPAQITWSFATLKNLLTTAYDVKAYQVSGPAWLDAERYDIAVKVPESSTKEQVKGMWQNLIAERFGVGLHHESKEFPVEELVVAKGGHKLKESPEDFVAPSPAGLSPAGPPAFKNGVLASPGFITTISPSGSGRARARTVAKAQPLSKLTEMLGNQLRRPVLDKTGLMGKYDFSMDFTLDLMGLPFSPLPQPATGPFEAVPADAASEAGTDVAAAIQEQLGLRLVASKAQLDVLVIDKAERVPTGN